MKIALDAMGGDYAPEEIVRGALEFLEEPEHRDVEVILVGSEKDVAPLASASRHWGTRLQLVHAPERIGMDLAPTEAVRRFKEASIVVAAGLVGSGQADALVSAGNTGVTMVAALRAFGRIRGVERPAVATVVPTLQGPAVLCDVGANVDCRPSHLVAFAQMGSVYAEQVLGIPKPRVALLSNGEEENKGSEVVVAAHAQLKELAGLNFIGNIEGRDIFHGGADVVVCDGFVGNIVLKLSEGLAGAIATMMREGANRNWRTKLGALLFKPALFELRRRMDYTEYGGALLLGAARVCVISHGASNAKAIKNAIGVAKEAVSRDVTQIIARMAQERVVTEI